MKLINFFTLILLLLVTTQSVFSQQEVTTTNNAKFLDKLNPIIYIGGGTSILKTRHETAKNSISNVRLVVSTPIISVKKWNFGVDVEGDYLFNTTINPAITPVETQDSSEPDITYSNSGKTGGFSIGGGPMAIFPLTDKLLLKSSFEFLYASLKFANQSVIQHYTYGDITTDFPLYSSTTKTANNLSLVPKLNLIYQFALIGVWLEGNYQMGPKMAITETSLEGASIDAKGRIVSEGEQVTTTTEYRLNGFGVNAGVSINLGSVGSGRTRGRATLSTDSHGSGRTRGRATLSGLQTTDNNNSTSTNPNPPIPAQAQDFNTTRSNRENRFSTNNPETNDSTSSTNSVNELKKKDSMPSRLSVTPTTARQTQGKTFGEKVNSGSQSGASALGGVPEPGIGEKLAPGLATENNGSGTGNSNQPTTTKQIQNQNFGGAPGGNFQGVVSAAPSGINQNDGNTTSTEEKPSISLEIVSPADGSVFKTSDKIKIQVNSSEKISENTSIKIYKVSDDVNFWKKNKDVVDKSVLAPISISTINSGNSITGEIKPGKLTTGAYQLMVVESDGTRVRGFTIIR